MAEKKNKPEQEKPDYNEIVKSMSKNMDTFETFYYAQMMRGGDFGKEGQSLGLTATIYGLREKIGTEGLLKGLEAQAEASIKSGNGLNAQFSLDSVIGQSAKTFEQSYIMLKPADIAKYVNPRIGKQMIVRGDKTLAELAQSKDESDKNYAAYIINQVRYAALIRGQAIALQEKAARETAAFNKAYPEKKK